MRSTELGGRSGLDVRVAPQDLRDDGVTAVNETLRGDRDVLPVTRLAGEDVLHDVFRTAKDSDQSLGFNQFDIRRPGVEHGVNIARG